MVQLRSTNEIDGAFLGSHLCSGSMCRIMKIWFRLHWTELIPPNSFLLAAAGFWVTELRQMTYQSFKGWGASLRRGFCSVCCTGRCDAGTPAWHLAPSLGIGRHPKHTSACSTAQGESCCVPGAAAAQVWCSQVSAPQRHNTDSWSPTGLTDLSLHTYNGKTPGKTFC